MKNTLKKPARGPFLRFHGNCALHYYSKERSRACIIGLNMGDSKPKGRSVGRLGSFSAVAEGSQVARGWVYGTADGWWDSGGGVRWGVGRWDGWGSAPTHNSARRFGFLNTFLEVFLSCLPIVRAFGGLCGTLFITCGNFFNTCGILFRHLRDFFTTCGIFSPIAEFFQCFFRIFCPDSTAFERENLQKPMKTNGRVLIPVPKLYF